MEGDHRLDEFLHGVDAPVLEEKGVDQGLAEDVGRHGPVKVRHVREFLEHLSPVGCVRVVQFFYFFLPVSVLFLFLKRNQKQLRSMIA